MLPFGRVILVRPFEFDEKMSQEMFFQGEGIADLQALAPAYLFDTLTGEKSQRFEDAETLDAVQSRVGQQVMQKSVRKEAQGTGHRVGCRHPQPAPAAGFEGIAFGPESVDVVAVSVSLKDDIQGLSQGNGPVKT